MAGLIHDGPDGTIAITAAVPHDAPTVTQLDGSEVQADFRLDSVKQVAGSPAAVLPKEVSALLAKTSVPVFLPRGDYLLLVYPDTDAGTWGVLAGLPGEFEFVGSDSLRQRCMIPGIGLGTSQEDVLRAANDAPHGPSEPMADVLKTLEGDLT